MADTFSKPSNGEQKLNWAKIWFKKFMKFHNIEFAKGQQWDFRRIKSSRICDPDEMKKRRPGNA